MSGYLQMAGKNNVATHMGILISGQWMSSFVLPVMGAQQALHIVTKPAPPGIDVQPGRCFLPHTIPTNPSGSPYKDKSR